jgi:hypothetical protein
MGLQLRVILAHFMLTALLIVTLGILANLFSTYKMESTHHVGGICHSDCWKAVLAVAATRIPIVDCKTENGYGCVNVQILLQLILFYSQPVHL